MEGFNFTKDDLASIHRMRGMAGGWAKTRKAEESKEEVKKVAEAFRVLLEDKDYPPIGVTPEGLKAGTGLTSGQKEAQRVIASADPAVVMQAYQAAMAWNQVNDIVSKRSQEKNLMTDLDTMAAGLREGKEPSEVVTGSALGKFGIAPFAQKPKMDEIALVDEKTGTPKVFAYEKGKDFSPPAGYITQSEYNARSSRKAAEAKAKQTQLDNIKRDYSKNIMAINEALTKAERFTDAEKFEQGRRGIISHLEFLREEYRMAGGDPGKLEPLPNFDEAAGKVGPKEDEEGADEGLVSGVLKTLGGWFSGGEDVEEEEELDMLMKPNSKPGEMAHEEKIKAIENDPALPSSLKQELIRREKAKILK